jgi:hypothetical protein
MNMRQKYGLFLFFFLMLPACLLAQSQLEVIRADSLNGIQQDLIMRKTLIGRVFCGKEQQRSHAIKRC